MARPTGAALALLTLATLPFPAPTATAGGDSPQAGYGIEEVLAPPLLHDPFGFSFDVHGVGAQLSNGSSVVFDGRRVVVQGDTGPLVAILLALPEATFPAFVRIDPSETFAVVAESSHGKLYRVPLDGSPATLLAQVGYPFDADFEGSQHLLLSAAPCGWLCGSEILRVDLETGALTTLVQLDGPSGPLAVDPSGDLYSALFQPSVSGPKSVVRFPAASLTGTPPLTAADGELIGSGFAGASSLLIDPFSGSAAAGGLLLAENNSANGASAIVRVGGPHDGEVLVQGKPFRWISELQWLPGDGDGVYHPFQGPAAGAIFYTSTWFAQDDIARRALRPKPAEADFTGPGADGFGAVTYALTRGPAHGEALLIHGAWSSWGTPQLWPMDGLPWISGFPLAEASAWPELFALDADGAFSTSFFNGTGTTGFLVVQAAVLDASGQFVGLSDPAAL